MLVVIFEDTDSKRASERSDRREKEIDDAFFRFGTGSSGYARPPAPAPLINLPSFIYGPAVVFSLLSRRARARALFGRTALSRAIRRAIEFHTPGREECAAGQ